MKNENPQREIVLVAAAADNDALGKNNTLLWHLPNDFKRFKTLTTGNFILMGRKTFESLPGILANRTHVVITRSANFKAENCLVAGSLGDAIKMVPAKQDVFVIGGGEIYAQAIEMADRIELTRVHAHFDADTFFPKIDRSIWDLEHEEHHAADDRHKYPFSFMTFRRRGENQ